MASISEISIQSKQKNPWVQHRLITVPLLYVKRSIHYPSFENKKWSPSISQRGLPVLHKCGHKMCQKSLSYFRISVKKNRILPRCCMIVCTESPSWQLQTMYLLPRVKLEMILFTPEIGGTISKWFEVCTYGQSEIHMIVF